MEYLKSVNDLLTDCTKNDAITADKENYATVLSAQTMISVITGGMSEIICELAYMWLYNNAKELYNLGVFKSEDDYLKFEDTVYNFDSVK